MSQASRALNLCNATIEFTGSSEMVEAERLLLVATHRRQAALSEVQRLKTEGAMRQQGIVRPASRGSLSVTSVTLPLKTSFVREVAAGSANYVYYFVALLRYRGQVIATQMLSSEDSIKGNAINFPNLVSFRDLEADFGVALEVYGLQTPRELLPHDAKYHIRKDRTKTPKKLLKQQSVLTSPAVQSPAGPGAVRATSFQLMGFIHLTSRNLANNTWALEKVPSQSPLDGGVLMKVTCHADCAVEERGFVTVFDDVSGFGAWHRRWCALSGSRLSFWKYPEDEQRQPASAEVDLRCCVTERVGAVPRDICARQNTLLLVTVRQARPEDEDSLVMQRRGNMTRIRHLLSLDTKDERQLWADQLNETLDNIRAWDPDAMQPHLDPSA
ncbi:anillin-like [Pollicipes pollicipes]|uniref:anillin-like n=1 Tax=Pollicipes pollicipes TaxID=41117 RepID=UPI0018853FE0|nr:anillin-like [Pollicipes pollicipes]